LEAAAEAGVGEQAFGRREVELERQLIGRDAVVRPAVRDWTGQCALAAERIVDDQLSVDRHVQRLTYARFGERLEALVVLEHGEDRLRTENDVQVLGAL